MGGGSSLHETTTIGVALPDGTAYQIQIGADLMDGLAAHPSIRGRRRVCIVSDSNVAPLYAGRVEAQCAAAGVASSCFVFEAGEASKTLATLAKLFDHLAEVRLLRGDAIVALGGGVVGDLAGFAAAVWMRGIDCIQMPTTLLAMVDSSVGGKTAVDLPAGKNLVGAFHQPVAVVSDTEVLATLPARELRAGLAEVVKYAAIGDPALFTWLEAHAAELLALEPRAVAQAISASCAAKAAIVAEDPSERGCRVLLNFGHSFGHALEAEAGYGVLLHGEAVAIGMMLAAHTSVRLGLAPPADTQRLRLLLQRLQLPTQVPEALRSRADALVTRMALDKKNLGDRLRLVLWRGIGQAITHEAEASSARAVFDSAD